MINWLKVKEFFKKIINGFVYIIVHFEIGSKNKAKDILLKEQEQEQEQEQEKVTHL